MVDVFDREKRSDVMSRIRSSGTRIELRLYEMVRALLGGRWRIDQNDRALPGAPDVVVPSLRLVILADGCFYHCCPKHGRVPDSNRAYWEPKLAGNVRRDRAHRRALRALGFSVWRFWEHDLEYRGLARTYAVLERRLAKRVLESRGATGG